MKGEFAQIRHIFHLRDESESIFSPSHSLKDSFSLWLGLAEIVFQVE